MRVAFVSRSTLFTGPGGDTMQMQKTAEHLGNLGVKVDIFTSDKAINDHDYDLIHGFNAIRPADLLKHFRKTRKPVALSPIYVDYSEYDAKGRGGKAATVFKVVGRDRAEYLKTVLRWLRNGERNFDMSYFLRGHRWGMKEVIRLSDMLLPNSNSEYRRLNADYGINKPYHVVPNAVDEHIFSNVPVDHKEKDLVICVARIDSQKNQLQLIRALSGQPVRLVVIGKPAPNHIAYAEQCRREAGANISFLSHMPQEELVDFYKRASVHAMPSWFETTGLSSLEASAMGCRVVISQKGDAPEYFGDAAFYCEPDNVASIREAVFEALAAPVNQPFRDKVFSQYIWSKTAEETLTAYEQILKARAGS